MNNLVIIAPNGNSSGRSSCPFFLINLTTLYFRLLKRTFAVEPLLAGALSLDLRSLSTHTRGGVSRWVFLEGPRNISSFYASFLNFCTFVLKEFSYRLLHILVEHYLYISYG